MLAAAFHNPQPGMRSAPILFQQLHQVLAFWTSLPKMTIQKASQILFRIVGDFLIMHQFI